MSAVDVYEHDPSDAHTASAGHHRPQCPGGVSANGVTSDHGCDRSTWTASLPSATAVRPLNWLCPAGLMTRTGAGTLEVGYWPHSGHTEGLGDRRGDRADPGGAGPGGCQPVAPGAVAAKAGFSQIERLHREPRGAGRERRRRDLGMRAVLPST
jgi:hypothetical protein